jgi:hypothetical protein
MFHRALLLMTMALAALALAVTPAFAGEEPDPHGSAGGAADADADHPDHPDHAHADSAGRAWFGEAAHVPGLPDQGPGEGLRVRWRDRVRRLLRRRQEGQVFQITRSTATSPQFAG